MQGHTQQAGGSPSLSLQSVPCPWADNRESPVGWRRLSTWPAARPDC